MTSSCSGLCSGSKADEPKIIERNRTRQFARYEDIINVQPVVRLKSSGDKLIRELSGESKVVYKGFDGITGKDIAWSKTILTSENYESIYKEAKLLHSLDHENVIKCYDCWVDFDDEFVTINMITEFYSGNLRDYSKKHWIERFQDTSPIINWCRNILKGLIYLHNLSPPIYLGSLYLEDLFVIGNSGTVKVGELCSAIVVEPEGGTTESNAADAVAKARSEIYEFGMCVLQMMSKDSVQRRWRDIHDRIRKVTDEELKEFIQKCIGSVDVRPTASELLNDPFLEPGFEDLGLYLTGCSLPDLRLSSVVEFPSSESSDQRLKSVLQSKKVVEKVITNEEGNKKFGLTGEVKDRELIHMNFLMYNGRRVKFYLSLETNTIQQVVKKIEVEYKLSAEDVLLVFKSMKELITEFLTEKSENDGKISTVLSEAAPYVLGMPTNGACEGVQRIHKTSTVQHQVPNGTSERVHWMNETSSVQHQVPNGTSERVHRMNETSSVQHQVPNGTSERVHRMNETSSVQHQVPNGTSERVHRMNETSSVQHQVPNGTSERVHRMNETSSVQHQVPNGTSERVHRMNETSSVQHQVPNGTSEHVQRIHETSSVQHRVPNGTSERVQQINETSSVKHQLRNGTSEGVQRIHETSSVQHQVRNGTSEGVQRIHETSSVQHQVRTSSGTRQNRNGAEKQQEWQVVTGKKKNRQRGRTEQVYRIKELK